MSPDGGNYSLYLLTNFAKIINFLFISTYSMASKLKTIDKRFSPSPDAYKIVSFNVGENGSKWGFGSEKRKNIGGSLSPGPGAYAHRSEAFEFERPKFYMGEKIKDAKETTKVPGAGTYDGNT